MDAELYVKIIEKALLPFIKEKFPMCHRFMQDNDPKHTSKRAQKFLQDNHLTWWKTAPESPDLNPIENLWHELKEFIRREVKPHTKDELIAGIKRFWTTVDRSKCTRCYILYFDKYTGAKVAMYLATYTLAYYLFCQHFHSDSMICRYIRHLSKVIPKVIGEPTGY